MFAVPEAVLLAIGVMAVGALGGYYVASRQLQPYVSDGAAELEPLEERFGGSRHSEHGEEWIIRDFFGEMHDGTFVDVGANHHERFSNTFYLETVLGWSGVAIEPQTKFAAGYAEHRPLTQFVAAFVSDHSDGSASLYVPEDDLVASGSRGFVEAAGGVRAVVEAPTITLDDVMERAGLQQLDFLSLDIELYEPQALAGFSIRRYQPRLVAVEAHLPVRQKILDYFARHGYVVVGKYLRADSHNLWFVPVAAAD
jgi:FkbM family methyltransferase